MPLALIGSRNPFSNGGRFSGEDAPSQLPLAWRVFGGNIDRPGVLLAGPATAIACSPHSAGSAFPVEVSTCLSGIPTLPADNAL